MKRPRFVLKLVPLPEVSDPIKALRAALKALRRRYGLSCVDLHEYPNNERRSSAREASVAFAWPFAWPEVRQPFLPQL
jgi:hypothetical protein